MVLHLMCTYSLMNQTGLDHLMCGVEECLDDCKVLHLQGICPDQPSQ